MMNKPCVYGPHKTLYNRFVRCSRMGMFNKIFAELAAAHGKTDHLMIDATHLKTHRAAASLLKKGCSPRAIGCTKGGLNSKLHAVCDGNGRPVAMLLSEGQMGDYRSAAMLLPALPKAKELLADRGYDADWFRKALATKGITPCIPPRKNRKTATGYDKILYKQRHKIENMFGKLKDWRQHLHALRPMRPYLLLSHLYRCNRHLLS